MAEIRVIPGEDGFDVDVTDGGAATSYRVTIPQGYLDELGVTDVAPEAAVRESFAFLLEREPPTSILPEFSLDVIARYFPEYVRELPRRLGA
jgi:hypothetical protein